jgi:uncharacterized repeat protein (TIGR01451 family)/fimbrial isopeptide formation D2 family protein
MGTLVTRAKSLIPWCGVLIGLGLWVAAAPAVAQVAAGYSEYFIPGDEDDVGIVLCSHGGGCAAGYHTHAVISVTAWSDTTTVYYDHWENGYNFDPANPGTTADETYTLNTGQRMAFESANIALPRTATPPTTTCNNYRNGTAVGTSTTCYDGRDHIYVAGGVVTVTRVGWIEERGVGVQGVAWEIYPIKPQLTTYVVPFGETNGWYGFQRVAALIQATQNNTVVTVDLNGDGTPDMLDTNRDGTVDAGSVTLQVGQIFLLDDTSAHVGGGNLVAGAVIQGTNTLQVKYIAGRTDVTYDTRGFSAFPRGLWTTDYYAPLDQPVDTGDGLTDYYLYNPNSSAITVTWESLGASGSFNIPACTLANRTQCAVSFRTATGGNVPVGSGLYLRATNAFWGVGSNDAQDYAHEWGYSLLPSTMLYTEHYLGWAPDCLPSAAGCAADMGAFLTVAQDNTRVFVDLNNDGTVDQTYTLNRLENQFVDDPADGDLSGARIWATGLFSMAYGQNSNAGVTAAPALDLGYVAIPATDFVSLVLSVDKSVSPQVVPTASGSSATFTIEVDSQKYTVDGVTVTDTLPASWAYTPGTATITRPDQTTLSGAAADPTIAGQTLTWSTAQTGGSMDLNQEITITFAAHTTAALAEGTLSQNRVRAVGTRTFSGVTQTFTATAFAYVVSQGTAGATVQISKASSVPATTPLYPGDPLTYTVTVTNPAGSGTTLTGVSLFDTLPAGVTAVAGSTTLSASSVGDRFGASAYSNSDGSRAWSGNWAENDDGGGGAGGGYIRVTGGQLRLNNDSAVATQSITRGVNLTGSGATWATLTFDYTTSGNLEAADVIVVQYRTGGAGAFTTFAGGTFTNDVTGSASFNIPLASPANLTEVRFAITSAAAYTGATEYFYVDNLFITYNRPVTGGDPPDLLPASYGYAIPAGQSLTATFTVTVNDPLPTGLTSITNTASTTSTQLPIQVSASVTNIVTNPSTQSASVAGRVWLDSDADGAQDIGEPGIANVEVTLKDQWGTPVATAYTDVNGRYLFSGVTPGNGYYVEATGGLPSGVSQTFPVGQTNNRTTTFNLVDGQIYTTADLGYRPAAGTVLFGDQVWVDANGNGVRDPGEVGLSGVSISLYRDTNGNGRYDEGVDALVATTTSAADGSYSFTGIPAGSSYFVIARTPVDGGNNPLYNPTTATTYLFSNVTAGTGYLTADFGFQANGTTMITYTISDRVWFDLNGNGTFDGGETGIPGVTVELLDASSRVIGTTATAADGTFTFSGVAGGGADYTVRISDNGGVLANYTGTTPYARARERAIPNLTGSIDLTSTPSYGFRPTRSIGDTVFHDLDGNGVQDAGETGIAGVVVGLYGDANGNGVINAGDTLIGSVTTDANGRYFFAGLADASYVVSVPPLTGYTFTGPGIDSDPGTAGTQKGATIAGGGDVWTVDFGFQATSSRTLGGTVWNDTNANGLIDSGETGSAGVTLNVLSGGTVVATVTTDASGAYSVQGLASGTYTVQLTDVSGVLTGDSPTYEKTEGTTPPFNYQETVNLTAGDVTDINFGYRRAQVTFSAIASFKAYLSSGSVRVEWRTSLEVGTVGFHLYRLNPASGRYRRLDDKLLPGLWGHPQGGTYRFQDLGAPTQGALTYTLQELDIHGRHRTYGPYTVSVEGEGPDAGVDAQADLNGVRFDRKPASVSRAGADRLRAMAMERRAAARRRPPPQGASLNITTGEAGLYYVGADQMAGPLGVSTAAMTALLGRGGLALSNRGRAVPYVCDVRNTGIYFYAEPIRSIYTAENVYQLGHGPALTMTAIPSTWAKATATSYQETVHREEDQYPVPVVFQDPDSDFWVWDYLLAGYDGSDTKVVTVPAPGVAGTGSASLTVHLVGASDGAAVLDHHVTVAFNGVPVGETTWGGIGRHDLEIPLSPGDVREGDNTVELKAELDAGVPESVVLLDSIALSYARRYRAVQDTLTFTAPGGTAVEVTGFSSSSVLLLDVTTPARPALVVGYAASPAGDGTYVVRFGAGVGRASRRYLAVAPRLAKAPVRVAAWRSAAWHDPSNRAEYVLITPDALRDAAGVLADYRNGKGIETLVIGLDAIYDEFNGGIAEPTAIREFLRYATSRWAAPPRYAALIGRGTWDYKNVLGLGDNLVPPLLAASADGLFASDIRLADLAGDDGVPEIAVGRIPVLTSQELLDYVAKVESQESAAPADWSRNVLMTADNPDEAGAFTADSDAVAALLPPDRLAEKIYLPDAGRQAIIDAVNGGVALFNYIGHGGFDRLADENLFTSTDVASLNNAGRLPVFLAMTCSVGDFALPGYPSLAEALLLKKDGGAIAAWAPSGLSQNDLAVRLNKSFFTSAFVRGDRVIGEMVVHGLEDLDAPGSAPMRYMYNLLGEPVSRLPE